MHRFHICDKVIIQEYLKRCNNNYWDEEECRDDEEFLKVEEELWAKMYPGQAIASAEDDEVGDEVASDSTDEGDRLCHFFDDPDNAGVMTMPLPQNELGQGICQGGILRVVMFLRVWHGWSCVGMGSYDILVMKLHPFL